MCNFSFLYHFSMKILLANRIAPDGTPRLAASHLGLLCLPKSHKKDAWLIWVNFSSRGLFCKAGLILWHFFHGETSLVQ